MLTRRDGKTQCLSMPDVCHPSQKGINQPRHHLSYFHTALYTAGGPWRLSRSGGAKVQRNGTYNPPSFQTAASSSKPIISHCSFSLQTVAQITENRKGPSTFRSDGGEAWQDDSPWHIGMLGIHSEGKSTSNLIQTHYHGHLQDACS